MTVTRLQQTKTDAALARERILATTLEATLAEGETVPTVQSVFEWLKRELAMNAYPLVEAVAEAVQEDVVQEVAELAQELDALAEDSEFLHEETIGQIMAVFEQGKVICQLLEAAVKTADQTTRKRAQNAIRTYRATESAVRDVVMAIPTLDGEGDPEAPEDDADPGEPGEGDPVVPVEGGGATPGQEG